MLGRGLVSLGEPCAGEGEAEEAEEAEGDEADGADELGDAFDVCVAVIDWYVTTPTTPALATRRAATRVVRTRRAAVRVESR